MLFCIRWRLVLWGCFRTGLARICIAGLAAVLPVCAVLRYLDVSVVRLSGLPIAALLVVLV